jgi:ABC-2 type transport system ATP-binding protein
MIHVENLTKYYKELCAVDRINFDVQKGEIMGLLGPNGAGKTTTLRMLTGFLRPTSGNIRIKEYSIEAQPLDIKRIMGYLPESAPLYHEMLVYDYLDYIAAIRAIDPAQKLTRIRQLAELCGLNSVMHQPVSELSKGFKQRVGLAHAMMNDPEILVLDEPTSGLDPNQIRLSKFVRSLNGSGKRKPSLYPPIFSAKPKPPATGLSSSAMVKSWLTTQPNPSNNQSAAKPSSTSPSKTRIFKPSKNRCPTLQVSWRS